MKTEAQTFVDLRQEYPQGLIHRIDLPEQRSDQNDFFNRIKALVNRALKNLTSRQEQTEPSEGLSIRTLDGIVKDTRARVQDVFDRIPDTAGIFEKNDALAADSEFLARCAAFIDDLLETAWKKQDTRLIKDFDSSNKVFTITEEADRGIRLLTGSRALGVYRFMKVRRQSGEGYWRHPEAAQQNLLEQCGVHDILPHIAAGHHDDYEDVEGVEKLDQLLPDEVFRGLFSDDDATAWFRKARGQIHQMVKGLTKIKGAQKEQAEIETWKKLLDAAIQSLHVLLVKLSEGLHNMHTLAGKADEKKIRRFAKLNYEFYLPLARRLGVWEYARELSEVCVWHLNPELVREYHTIITAKQNHIIENLAPVLRQQLSGFSTIRKIEICPRGIDVFAERYQKADQLEAATQEDFFAGVDGDLLHTVRVTVGSEEEIPDVCRKILSLFSCRSSTQEKKWGNDGTLIEMALADGYLIKFRINTEKKDIQRKSGELGVLDKTGGVSDVIGDLTKVRNGDLNNLQENLRNRTVKIKTPKGESLRFAPNKTVLDFVNAIHSGFLESGQPISVYFSRARNGSPGTRVRLFDPVHLYDGGILQIVVDKRGEQPDPAWPLLCASHHTASAVRRGLRKIGASEERGRAYVNTLLELFEKILPPGRDSDPHQGLIGLIHDKWPNRANEFPEETYRRFSVAEAGTPEFDILRLFSLQTGMKNFSRWHIECELPNTQGEGAQLLTFFREFNIAKQETAPNPSDNGSATARIMLDFSGMLQCDQQRIGDLKNHLKSMKENLPEQPDRGSKFIKNKNESEEDPPETIKRITKEISHIQSSQRERLYQLFKIVLRLHYEGYKNIRLSAEQ